MKPRYVLRNGKPYRVGTLGGIRVMQVPQPDRTCNGCCFFDQPNFDCVKAAFERTEEARFGRTCASPGAIYKEVKP